MDCGRVGSAIRRVAPIRPQLRDRVTLWGWRLRGLQSVAPWKGRDSETRLELSLLGLRKPCAAYSLTGVGAAFGIQPGGAGPGGSGRRLPPPHVLRVLLGEIQEAAHGEARASRGGHPEEARWRRGRASGEP